MLRRAYRLSAKEVSDIMRRGRSFHSEAFMVRTLHIGGRARAAVVAGVKVSKKATERNYQKRRVRHLLASHLPHIAPGMGVAVVLKAPVKEKSFSELSRELENLLQPLRVKKNKYEA